MSEAADAYYEKLRKNGSGEHARAQAYPNDTTLLYVDGVCYLNGVPLPSPDKIGAKSCNTLAHDFDIWLDDTGPYMPTTQFGGKAGHRLGEEWYPELYLKRYCVDKPQVCGPDLVAQLADLPDIAGPVMEAGIGSEFVKLMRMAAKKRALGMSLKVPIKPGRSAQALGGFTEKTFGVGSHTLKLTKERMGHFLERHHPRYWDGSIKGKQSFFRGDMTIGGVEDVIAQVLKQRASEIAAKAPGSFFNVSGWVNGRECMVGISNNGINMFYPVLL